MHTGHTHTHRGHIYNEREIERENHTYPMDIVWFSEVTVNPVENV